MLKFKNSEIETVANFLNKAPLKSKASRARTLLIKKLNDKFGEYASFQKEVLEEYAKKKENGELYKDEQGNFHWEVDKVDVANNAMTEIGGEEVYLDIEEYRPNMKFLTVSLNNLDMELSGNEAIVYDLLMDQLEKETEEEHND